MCIFVAKFPEMQIQDTTISAVFTASGLEQVSVGGMEIMERTPMFQPTWYFIYLILLVGLLAWIRFYYGNILVQTVQGSTNFRVANRTFKDTSLLQSQLDALLYLFYFLSMAFLFHYIELRLNVRPYGLEGGRLYAFNLFLLLGLFLGRMVLFNITGMLFNRLLMVREYLYNIFIFNKLSGLAVTPLLILLVYTKGILKEIMFWTIIFVVSAIILMRLIRGVVFSYKKEVLVFYMFLYLCALEIAPLVLLYRWLEGIL